MPKQSRPPPILIRPHAYVPDVTEAADWKGERPCMGCKMPPDNRVHTEYRPAKDNTDRIVGERER